ncbi:MAG: DEAD/DEAH box helicase family protein [Lentisphaeria bacterium]|nr:DEAD/DEAH box helicase family protein [Lentisphaeria bacterium]
MPEPCKLTFSAGTLLLSSDPDALFLLRDELTFDDRVRAFRAPAYRYEAIMRILYGAGIEVLDHARDYPELPLTLHSPHKPLKHQQYAMQRWLSAKRRGVVVMPTGSGKTFFAFLAMQSVQRPTLVIVPTIDLLHQWARQLEDAFQIPVGMLGGGSHDVLPVTVSTYDSAVLNMERIGNRFGLVIFDECHHLPGEVNRNAATLCLAPYRLGLTATPERNDDGEEVLRRIVGETVCRIHIDELEGTVLAPYITRRIFVPLEPDEQAEYQAARKKYVDFVRANNIDFRAPDGWQRFMLLCARMNGGRAVLQAWLRQREIARCGRAKLNTLWKIIREHPGERCIIFTADNDTAYRIGEALCLPVLTHKTKAAERKLFLEKFRSGEYTVLVTSRVLNEGVDVPEASIGIVVSGSAGTREHVQRLGRILRRSREGKLAQLFELVSEGTSEMNVSERRRANRAYNRWGTSC